MPDSVREAGMKNVLVRLQEITVLNGYTNNLGPNVQRFKQGGNTYSAVPLCLMKEGGEQSGDGPSGGVALLTHRLRLSLLVATTQDEAADARSGDEVINSLRADVLKAMLKEPRTFGDKFKNVTYLGDSEIEVETDQQMLSTEMLFEIQYRHRADDPTLTT